MMRMRQLLRSAAWLWVALAVLAAGCRSDEPCPDDGEDGGGSAERMELTAVFTLNVDGPEMTTRATPTDGPYDPGAGWENYIDIAGEDFRFYFFGTDNAYIGELTVTDVLPVGSNPGAKKYEVSGRVPKDVAEGGKQIKIMALANWGTYPTAEELAGRDIDFVSKWGVYDYDPASNLPSATNKIPLYGITNPVTLTFDPLGMARVEELHLLRAWAKIEVKQKEGDGGQTLEDARVYLYNTEGFKAPAGITTKNDYVHGNYEDDYTQTPHIPTTSVRKEKYVTLTKSGDGKSWIGYLPEFLNKGESYPTRVEVKFAQSEKWDNVEFREYKEDGTVGSYFDVLRNNWYKFTISKRLELEVMVQVVPYREVDLTPDFGLGGDYPLSPVYNNNGEVIYWFDPAEGVIYSDMWRTIRVHPAQMLDISIDPVTGTSIIRDDNSLFICFTYTRGDNDGHGSEHKDYAFDTITEIYCPLSNRVNVEGVDQDGQQVVTHWLPKRAVSDDFLLYWQIENSSDCYAPDGKTLIEPPFTMALNDPKIDMDETWPVVPYLKYVKKGTGEVVCYLRVADRKWLGPDMETELTTNPFPEGPAGAK